MNVRSIARPLALVLFAAGCGPQAPARLSTGKPVATVNGVQLTSEDLDLVMHKKPHGESEGAPEMENMAARAKAALEGLLHQEVVAQKAVALGLDKDAQVRERLIQAEAQYLAARRAVLADAYVARELMGASSVSDADVQAYIDQNAEKLKTELVIWQIAVDKDSTAIQKYKAELDAGQPFEAVAASRFPKLPAGMKPWELPPLRYLQLPSEWRDKAFAMEPGQVSEIFTAGDRQWIIKVVAKKSLPDANLEAEKPAIKTALQAAKAKDDRQAKLDALFKAAKISYGE
jgi:parvulin-like peptidyl-prolyl isomerase